MENRIADWRAVVGWEGLYKISANGVVRSCNRRVMKIAGGGSIRSATHYIGRDLRDFKTGKGYRSVKLSKQGAKPRTVYIHDMVLRAFVGPPPVGHEACHRDGDPANNALSNLRWDSRSANAKERVAHGRCFLKNNPGLRWRVHT